MSPGGGISDDIPYLGEARLAFTKLRPLWRRCDV